MLILLSPAKNLDFEPAPQNLSKTSPRLSGETELLLKRTKSLSRSDLRSLMKLSENLADLNYERFQALSDGLPDSEAKQAILAFNGDVYRGLDAGTLQDNDLNWAQTHLRLLSGLYGVLRPMDSIHPYRLEMGTRLDTDRGATLYDFWGDRISKQLNEDMTEAEGPILNLASKEYFGAVNKKALKSSVIDVDFREVTDKGSKIISFYAKYARGLMARWVIENRITDASDLKTFDIDGYGYQADQSSAGKLVFSRPKPEPKS
ncbi:peroxide stress protein YaaA [Ponticaulis profundi]|uniref:UPF0246 protein ACFQDM_17115 n=1 Tax=Ponticaulis profundi TaxID=2665222 RepID=A0ABW1SE06_9PROT